MGLFSSVFHVRDIELETFVPCFHRCLAAAGFVAHDSLAVPPSGPGALPDYDDASSAGPCYLASPLSGHWLTVIEEHVPVEGAPWLADLANRLSSELSCYVLALMVHDDDVFYYNLEHDGRPLDGYNSCPQYFEQRRLPDSEVESQRHTPEAFELLLPPGHTVDKLRALLNRGWWNSYDAGKLDADGVATEEADGFASEGDRMTAFGTLLQLHGFPGDYPYAAWAQSQNIPWATFLALRYRSR